MDEDNLDYKMIIISLVLVFFIGFFVLGGLEFTGMTAASTNSELNFFVFLPAIAIFLLVVFLMWRGEHFLKHK